MGLRKILWNFGDVCLSSPYGHVSDDLPDVFQCYLFAGDLLAVNSFTLIAARLVGCNFCCTPLSIVLKKARQG